MRKYETSFTFGSEHFYPFLKTVLYPPTPYPHLLFSVKFKFSLPSSEKKPELSLPTGEVFIAGEDFSIYFSFMSRGFRPVAD